MKKVKCVRTSSLKSNGSACQVHSYSGRESVDGSYSRISLRSYSGRMLNLSSSKSGVSNFVISEEDA